jgi:hypothetical protein
LKKLRRAHHPNDNRHILYPCSTFGHHLIPLNLHIRSQYQDHLHAQVLSLLLSCRHRHLVLPPLILYLCAQIFHHLALDTVEVTFPLSLSLTYHGPMHVRRTLKIDSHASPHQQDCRSRGWKTQNGSISAWSLFPKPSHPVARSSHNVFCLGHLPIFKAKQNYGSAARMQLLHAMGGPVKTSTITSHS